LTDPQLGRNLRRLGYLSDSLNRKVIFFTGKGGVGKSTLAWATALALHRQGKKVAIVGWQPLGKQEAPPVAGELGMDWLGLETLAAFREYALGIIKFQKIYDSVLDNKILRTFVLAAPGLADAVVGGKIWDVYDKGIYDTLVVDMPSSGHARSFFKSPLGLKKIFKVGFIARDTDRVCALFSSPQTRLDLVALPEELPLVECRELKESLAPLHPFSFGFLHVNQCLPDWVGTTQAQSNNVPGSIGRTLQDFNERLADQKQTLALAAPIGMPSLLTPRFAVDGWKQSVEAAATHLESL
jgi:energy-coupling factor transporter ATP-binding protein EcfA2